MTTPADRKTLDQMNSNDLDHLYDRLDRVRALEAGLWENNDQQTRPVSAVCHEIANSIRCALGEPAPATTAPGFIPYVPGHIPRTGNTVDGLVVEPYRNDHGERAWVFRCWGTDDGCDGWLSLDHTSQQSAERARDRHVAEEHKEH